MKNTINILVKNRKILNNVCVIKNYQFYIIFKIIALLMLNFTTTVYPWPVFIISFSFITI